MVTSLLMFILGSFLNPSNENYLYHHQVAAKAGDGALRILHRYHLDEEDCNVSKFYELNGMQKDDQLLKGKKYFLPVLIYKYNGKSIRSTIGDPDYPKALRIQQYNERILNDKLRKSSYTSSKILWVPYSEMNCKGASKPTSSSPKIFTMPILGKKHRNITRKSEVLRGHVFYLVAGHGGPDPGAIGKRGSINLCEDEYAYDVTLRLYKLLWEHGANAYMVIEDKNDGIREGQILPCDKDERCNNQKLPLNQRKRLAQRVKYVNALFAKHKKKGVKDQSLISIHVDSRSASHRQDVFFCHYPSSKSSKKFAQRMQATFDKNYKRFRKNGKYHGKVTPRGDLYVLRNTTPKAILIELANIQNKSDHRRILQATNRQALANWMLEGILK